MPELPEVETIRRALAPRVHGEVLERLEVLDPRFSAPAPPEELAEAASGRRIARLTRRGKYLVWRLALLADDPRSTAADGSSPEAAPEPLHLVMHLRMTGNLLLGRPAEADAPPRQARDPAARGRLLELLGRGGRAETRVEDLEALEHVSLHPRREGAADRLDLGQLGHGPSLGGAPAHSALSRLRLPVLPSPSGAR